MIDLNYNLLKDLYCVFSPSGSEKKMRRFIKRYIYDNVKGAIVEQDSAGNLYVTKGESESYPCLCAHMDQVQRLHPKDFCCIESDDVIFGYSPKTRQQCGLGADDKNGIFIALTCLQEYDVLKCAFFVGEEIGCVGSRAADVSFFDDCRFCAQIDRRGDCDMVTDISDVMCSEEFIKDADCETFGYRIHDGLMTDVDTLRNRGVKASCINMSCGYYEPHTNQEFTDKGDLYNCYVFVCHLIEDCTKVYTFETPAHKGNMYSWTDESWEYDECYEWCNTALRNKPSLTFEEFKDDVSGMYKSLSDKDLEKIYDWCKYDIDSNSDYDSSFMFGDCYEA